MSGSQHELDLKDEAILYHQRGNVQRAANAFKQSHSVDATFTLMH